MTKLTFTEYIREKNLCTILEQECTNEFVVKIDSFFTDLFSGLTIYTNDGKPDLIFMKGDRYIMKQDLKNRYLWCRYEGFWGVLNESFSLERLEIQAFIKNAVEEAYQMGSLTPEFHFGLFRE